VPVLISLTGGSIPPPTSTNKTMTNEDYKGLSFSYDSNNPQKPQTQVLEYREETDEYVVLHYSEKEIMAGSVVRNLIEAERGQRVNREHYNESTLDTSKLKGLKTYCYTTKTFGDIFFSLVPFYKQDIFIASTTPDMDDAWITGDLEAFGQPI